jgi:RNA polymerase sigma factor (sigma-70 family)
MTTRFFKQLCQLVPDLTDGQLLARFVVCREECAFAALVQRHGPLVWNVCRRVLRHQQDAEDAFQATFLVLARKARSVQKRESVGGWLYKVAYRIALKARGVNLRRRVREKQVDELPQPAVAPTEPQDWRPLLDQALERLPEKYRVAVVLCDLEGLSRQEAARQLGIPEGTLSSRLATARRLLAKRLVRSEGILAVAMAEGLARAAVPTRLVEATVHAAVSPSVVSPVISLLMNGALKAMFLNKMRLVLGLVLVVGVLGATGLAYRAGGTATAAAQPGSGKPASEVEALRKEVELLRLNLLVVLEKVRSQEAELRALRGQAGPPRGDSSLPGPSKSPSVDFQDLGPRVGLPPPGLPRSDSSLPATSQPPKGGGGPPQRGFPGGRGMGPPADPLTQAQEALKALRSARDGKERQRAEEALEKALERMRLKKTSPDEF